MIIDNFLNNDVKKPPMKLIYPRSTIELVAREAQTARRFVFDKDASQLAGKLALEAGDLVIAHRQFAIPPYPSTYVEVDGVSFFGRVNNLHRPVPDPDHRFAYLFNGPYIYEFTASTNTSALTFFRIKLSPPGEGKHEPGLLIPFRGGDKEGKSAVMGDDFKMVVMLGTHAKDAPREIADEATFEWVMNPFPRTIDAWTDFFFEWNGTVRNAWALLLWLNQPARIRTTSIGPSRSIVRGKLRTYRAHHIVTIDLNKKYRTIRRAFLDGAERTPPRRHEVRGSFHHHGGLDTGCGHDWPLMPDLDGVWTCTKCQRRRWWVRDHMRGDATRGFVTKEYDTVVKKETTP